MVLKGLKVKSEIPSVFAPQPHPVDALPVLLLDSGSVFLSSLNRGRSDLLGPSSCDQMGKFLVRTPFYAAAKLYALFPMQPMGQRNSFIKSLRGFKNGLSAMHAPPFYPQADTGARKPKCRRTIAKYTVTKYRPRP